MKIKLFALYGLLIVVLGLGMQGCLKEADDPNAQHNAEVTIIDNYFKANTSIENVVYDNYYGFRFFYSETGELPPPHKGEKVKGTYTARLLSPDGEVGFVPFDSGTIDDELEDIKPGPLGYLASLMLEGSTATVFSPSRYAYGEGGNASLGVPPNSIIVYTLTLTEVVRSPSYRDQMKVDSTKIKTYLDDAELDNVVMHPSKVWYEVTTPGTGDFMTPFSIVKFEYELRILQTSGPGDRIDFGTLEGQSVWNYIDGFKLALPLLQKGSEATIYIPSGLGYGDATKENIPKKSNLVFKVKILEFQ